MIEQSLIFQPFLAMMCLTIVVWVYLYVKRIPFIVNSDLTPEQMQSAEFISLSPADVNNPSDNFKNLFELPVLFYGICLYLYVAEQVDQVHLVLAWVFVLFRVLHSAVHCTFNLVILRFWLYCIASLSLFGMIIRSGVHAFF